MGILSKIAELLYPEKCIFCGKILDDGRKGACPECGASLPAAEGRRAVSEGNFYSVCVCPFYYEGKVREAVHRFKFRGRSGYAVYFAEYMAESVAENIERQIDVISFVPVSRKRLAERGYDQAKLLAEKTADMLGLPFMPLLIKERDNPPQSGIDGAEKRRANVLGAYRVTDPDYVGGKRILLVDDVCTTGATMGECAKTLLLCGAEEVFGAAIAKTRQGDI